MMSPDYRHYLYWLFDVSICCAVFKSAYFSTVSTFYSKQSQMHLDIFEHLDSEVVVMFFCSCAKPSAHILSTSFTLIKPVM